MMNAIRKRPWLLVVGGIGLFLVCDVLFVVLAVVHAPQTMP